ncbi:mycothiol conjugate amidase Mca [Actinoplanes sp. N902-109]|uniref:mycothiol conjugate amidase Mca n=1 Tax=Actinoplanes sp. (strain N902-109) TaxID=649831 RepID=UPI0003295418|nr:mycothiol conjugate amidase Mca [Actinoplanes sp. N902-109]AGL18968.1 mycothiol S-conjugate amidase Mca acetylase LmbE [Actinoplanes sp. N902-109]
MTRPARGDLSGLRLLTVHAHPDDESSKGAATLVKYARAGAGVLICTMTGGERGDVLNPALDRPEVRAGLPARRRAEMARAREILGVRQRFLGFVDSGLPRNGEPVPADGFAVQPLEVATRALVAAVREFRPHVLVTYDENGGYPHPDHIRTNRVAVAAFHAAGDVHEYPDAGPVWSPSKLYYTCAFNRDYFVAIDAAMTAAGLDSPARVVLDTWPRDWPAWEVTTRVECAEYFPVRRAALLAHETQVDPAGPELSCPLGLEMKAWPTEDYHLVCSAVPTELPEDDLFAGIVAG